MISSAQVPSCTERLVCKIPREQDREITARLPMPFLPRLGERLVDVDIEIGDCLESLI